MDKLSILKPVGAACICGLFLFSSCSKESLDELQEESVDSIESPLTSNLEMETSTTSFECFYPSFTRSAVAGINSVQTKVLSTTVYQTDTRFFVDASYVISLEKDLPATITISIQNKEIVFQDVQPGESVGHSFEIPSNFTGGEIISYSVVQKAFLEPVEISGTYSYSPPCNIELGAKRFGGVVIKIFEEGDEGYVAGEVHGIVLSENLLGDFTWENGMVAAQNYVYQEYDDWYLPNKDLLYDIILENYGALAVPTNYENAFWSATREGEYAYAASDGGTALYSLPFLHPITSRLGIQPVRNF